MKKIFLLSFWAFTLLRINAQPCVSPNPNLVLNPGFETGTPPGANGPNGSLLTNNVANWASLFGNPNQIQTSDYWNNIFGMTQNRCAAMYVGYGGTALTINTREGLQGKLSQPIQSNSGIYCFSFQLAKHPFSFNVGTIRMVVYGIKINGNFTVFNNSPLGALNMNMLYPGIQKIPLALFDVSNVGATPVFMQRTFNSNIIPNGSSIDAIIITRSDEISRGQNDIRYMLVDEVVLRKL